MNEWMNEWMKYLMDLLYNLILVEISLWREQENHNNIYYLYKVMPTIIQGIIIFMNEFD